MDIPVLPSTLLLTLLLLIGLIFFIRASAKDRTQTVRLASPEDEAVLMPQVKEYIKARSYRVAAIDPLTNKVTMTGSVRPSVFLTVFLSLLAAVGLSCLSLVISQLFPNVSLALLGIVPLSPLAGIFYWNKAGRIENVVLQLENTEEADDFSSKLTLIAHRDEVIEIQKTLELVSID